MRRAQPWVTNRARTLRANGTSAESILWSALRNRQLGGLKFIRQVPIAGYFCDFVCREAKVVIEVDGGTHQTDQELAHDRERETSIATAGFRILRLQNRDIYTDLQGALDMVLAFAIDGAR